jgi:hypothetical protein
MAGSDEMRIDYVDQKQAARGGRFGAHAHNCIKAEGLAARNTGR